jgi:flagellin
VNGTASGITTDNALSQINNQLSGIGITASLNQTTGSLQFSGSGPFSVSSTASHLDGLTAAVTTIGPPPVTTYPTALFDNQSLYTASSTAAVLAGSFTAAPTGETFSLVGANNQTVQVTLLAGDASVNTAVLDINAQSQALGITASVNSAGGLQLSSNSAFTMVQTINGAAPAFTAVSGNVAVSAPATTTSSTGNALSSLTAIANAVRLLGQVQGKVGAGENTLAYATDLANSQITNFSSAESNIRDADVAAEAANLTKAQVLQQSSIAAMAQANSSPQAVLKLLQQ